MEGREQLGAGEGEDDRVEPERGEAEETRYEVPQTRESLASDGGAQGRAGSGYGTEEEAEAKGFKTAWSRRVAHPGIVQGVDGHEEADQGDSFGNDSAPKLFQEYTSAYRPDHGNDDEELEPPTGYAVEAGKVVGEKVSIGLSFDQIHRHKCPGQGKQILHGP